jgi:hypothetical protein
MVNSYRCLIRHSSEYRDPHRGALGRFVDGECRRIAGRGRVYHYNFLEFTIIESTNWTRWKLPLK